MDARYQKEPTLSAANYEGTKRKRTTDKARQHPGIQSTGWEDLVVYGGEAHGQGVIGYARRLEYILDVADHASSTVHNYWK